MRNYAIRKANRHTKAMRRIHEDRMEHGSDHSCPCFGSEDKQTAGIIFSRFADHPTMCSGPCCGNPRRHFNQPTNQEKRAPKVSDWD